MDWSAPVPPALPSLASRWGRDRRGFRRRAADPLPFARFCRHASRALIALGDHPLNLERYREDYHGPCARMTRTNREV